MLYNAICRPIETVAIKCVVGHGQIRLGLGYVLQCHTCFLSNDTACVKSAQHQRARRAVTCIRPSQVSTLCVRRCADRGHSADRADAVFKDIAKGAAFWD